MAKQPLQKMDAKEMQRAVQEAHDKPFSVSQSKINKFRMCRNAYHYAYVLKLRKKKKARPLKFGSIVHDMIEADIEGKNPFKVLKEAEKLEGPMFLEEREQYGDLITDIRYIMTAYFKWWDGKPDDVDYIKRKGKSSEHGFELEIDKGLIAKGRIDASAKAKGLKWLVEHKSHKSFPQPEERWRNLQSVFYIRIYEMMGWGLLDGTLWDYIRSKPPTRPEILQSGKMSERALDSLPQVVIDTIKSHGLNPKDYPELVARQEVNQSSWFQRIFTPVSKSIIQPVYDEFLESAREMRSQHGRSRVRTFGRHCSWCDFRDPCGASLQGHDEDFILKKDFTNADEKEIEQSVEPAD
jgi:hypothetical protein